MTTCRLLVHDTFQKRYVQFQGDHPEAGKSLISQLKQARANPGSGERIKGTEIIPSLRGKLYKRWVGGRRKFRLFYYYHAGRAVLFPLYLTDELRGNFDYREITPIVEAAVLIVTDYDNPKTRSTRFIEPRFP